MDSTRKIRGKVFFFTECLWLQGYKPSGSIADAESIGRVYRGSLKPDDDDTTRNLGTAVGRLAFKVSWASLRLK